MIYFLLFFEFFRIGLFSIGGGLATLPFLIDLAERRPEWLTGEDISNMVAVSESTPGPMGINMATYVGNNVLSVPGAIAATLGEIAPSIIIIIIIAHFLSQYKENKFVQGAFYTLRAVVIALIAYAAYQVYIVAFFPSGNINLLKIIVSAAILISMFIFKKIHPVFFILIAAVLGLVLPI